MLEKLSRDGIYSSLKDMPPGRAAERRGRMVTHPIPPVFDSDSEILILGSFPSVMSRETGFFYGHPKDRFWKVMATVFVAETPETIAEKRSFLLENRVALWDVLRSCDINGSSDSSIRNAVPNDLDVILRPARIKKVFVNGKTALAYYEKYSLPVTGMRAVCLPSTSPANAAWSTERLVAEWKRLLAPGRD